MSTFTEDDIRQALKEFTDIPGPAGVHEAAVSRAKRMRVRRTAAVATVAVAMIAGLVAMLPHAIAPAKGTTDSVAGVERKATPPTVSDRVNLFDGWYFAAGPTTEGARVWNPGNHTYDLYPDASAWPSPDGTKVAVTGGAGLFLHGPGIGTLELVPDKPIIGAPQWTAAGDKLLFGIDQGMGPVQYRILDIPNQKMADVPKLGCGRYCVLTWLPGFKQVGHFQSDGTTTVYDVATGHKTGVLKFQAHSASAWSPSGTKIVTDSAVVDPQGHKLCSLSIGTTARTYWLDSGDFMVVNELVRIVGDDCRVQETRPLPANWTVTEPAEYTIGHD